MLNIGVFGYTLEHAVKMLSEIIENDQDSKPTTKPKYKGILEDGTLYHTLAHNLDSIRGRRLDQLIICDEEVKGLEIFQVALLPCLVTSCVPDEFLVQVYDV